MKTENFLNGLFAIAMVLTMCTVIFGIVYENRDKDAEIESLKHRIESVESQKDTLQLKYDSLHTLNWDNIDYWMDHFGIEHQEIVRQQIVLETGDFTSYLCREQNNLFGMRHPRVRETTSLGEQNYHAYYRHYIDSIKDYALWQQSQYKEGDYYSFLTAIGYAEHPKYVSLLKNTSI